jgi:hypothetical protein
MALCVPKTMLRRLVFTDSAEGNPDSGRMTAYSEEILPLSEQWGATGPDNALLVEVQPLTPPKSGSGKLATIFKLAHYWRSGRLG